jgi:DNA-directed RNA polymerase subunit RPC12/RpoP
MIKKCPKCCTQAFEDTSLFCYYCGTSLPTNLPEIKSEVCPNCGSKILNKESMFCERCGSPLSLKPVSIQRIKPIEICAQCGAPIIDTDRIYCKKCGAYVRELQPREVSSIKKYSVSKPLVKKPVILMDLVPNAENNTTNEKVSALTKGTINLSVPNAKVLRSLFILAGVLILFFLGYSLIGPSNLGLDNLNFGNKFPSPDDVPITQDLSSMALKINDLPPGWVVQRSSGTLNQYLADFVESSTLNNGFVTLDMRRYATIDNAKREYYSLIARSPNVRTEAINLGNEGFGYIYSDKAVIIFRRGNVIVKIEDVRTAYHLNPTINNAKDYAHIVADRIQ